MSQKLKTIIVAALGLSVPFSAMADIDPGTVTEYTGVNGEFIVFRDNVTYSLSTGEELRSGDVLRATNSGEATVTFDGCTYTLPAGQDITLDENLCTEMAALEAAPTQAELAANETPPPLAETTTTGGAGNAPLIIGGVVVAAGGIAAAAGGGGGGDTPTSP